VIWLACGIFIVLFGGGFIWGFVVRGWEVKKLEKKYDDYFQLSVERMCDTQDEIEGLRDEKARLYNEVIKHDKDVPIDGPDLFSRALKRIGRARTQGEVICALLEEMKRGTERAG
jgi:hypothetical protein